MYPFSFNRVDVLTRLHLDALHPLALRKASKQMLTRTLAVLSILLLTLLLPVMGTAATPETIIGKVVGIHDGDTLTLLDDSKRQIKIRLAEIDAPELSQPFGKKSKQMLSTLVFGKDATIVASERDKYGRTVGRVFQGNVDVNLTMVRQGGAWAYRKYLTDSAFLTAEASAKTSGVGLWGLQADQRVPPWEYRHAKKSIQKTVTFAPAIDGTFTCGTKATCSQMASCAEARFYLTKCGFSKLDRDSDGIPCEKLCR